MYDPPVLYDTFTDINGTILSNHAPEINVAGGGWKQIFQSGTKNIVTVNGKASLTSITATTITGAIVNAGVTNYKFSGKIKLKGTADNVFFRSDSTRQQFMQINFLPSSSAMVLYVQQSIGFSELARVSVSLSVGVEYPFEIIVNRNVISITVNGVTVSIESALLEQNTWVGILCFGSEGTTQAYDDFKVEPVSKLPVYVTPENIYVVKYENRVLEPGRTLDFIVPSEQRTLYVR